MASRAIGSRKCRRPPRWTYKECATGGLGLRAASAASTQPASTARPIDGGRKRKQQQQQQQQQQPHETETPGIPQQVGECAEPPTARLLLLLLLLMMMVIKGGRPCSRESPRDDLGRCGAAQLGQGRRWRNKVQKRPVTNGLGPAGCLSVPVTEAKPGTEKPQKEKKENPVM